MKKIISVITALSVCLGMCISAFSAMIGTTYYIDPINGDNANDGKSAETAYLDFANIRDRSLSAGDRVLVKRGCLVNDPLIINCEGTEEFPVLVSAYGEGDNPVFTGPNGIVYINNANHLIFENIDFRNNDYALHIYPINNSSSGNITVRNCCFCNISYHPGDSSVNSPCIYICNDHTSVLHDLHIHDIEIKNCAKGIETKGISRESFPEYFVDEETSYNYNFLFENINMENLLYDGIIIGSLRDSTVRNCRLINTCQSNDCVTAPLWTHHADGITMEYCEISGANGGNDGMAIDFDGWSTNCTCQYIYSHDNKRFMRNCLYDSETHNSNNTVRYCLSVNDNRALSFASFAIPGTVGIPTTMNNFSFCNNTLINCSPIMWLNLKNVTVRDNIFVGTKLTALLSLFFFPVSFGRNNIDGNVCCNYNSFPFCNTIFGTPDFRGGDEYDINSYKLAGNSTLNGKGCFTEESTPEMAKIPTA